MQELPNDYAKLLSSPDYIKTIIEEHKLDDITYDLDQIEYAPYLKDLLFNKDYSVFYKITNETETHYNFKYKDGRNGQFLQNSST